jgi:hypothetical protein
MDRIIRHLKRSSDWSSRPLGVAGATILSRASSKCEQQFQALLEDYKGIPWVDAQLASMTTK